MQLSCISTFALLLRPLVSSHPFDGTATLAKERSLVHPSLSKTADAIKRFPDFDTFSSDCNLQNAIQYMDLSAASSPSSLPNPESNLTLFHVALGRGTQNYTCATSDSSTLPVSIGALATLFNASCIAADDPTLLSMLPGIALDLPLPKPGSFDAMLLSDVSGHQYFVDNYTVPYFNLDTRAHRWGRSPMAKTAEADAPSDAPAGAHGAVQWLMLDAVPASSSGDDGDDDVHERFQQIYRLNTAGGDAPATCDGMDPAFEVQYAAQYWFFV